MAATHILDEDETDEDDDSTVEPVPTATEASNALNTLRMYVQQHGSKFEMQYKYEKFVNDLIAQNKRQAKITEYFNVNNI